jgi:hypothetical protein
MYDRYTKSSYIREYDKCTIINGYGDIPSPIPVVPLVINASVSNAQKCKSVLLVVVPAMIVLLGILWNIVRKRRTNENTI